ncbi:MAG: hypothetical protein HF978_10620 [Desulfobacteraceae bacterium]|nr:hypothetical protein [Desulfobacteraceae bacterium]MBC2755988.1 hypothetical protein [Desulfobacteraceae bacterium]
MKQRAFTLNCLFYLSLLILTIWGSNVDAADPEPTIAPLNPAFVQYMQTAGLIKADSEREDEFGLGEIPSPIDYSFTKGMHIKLPFPKEGAPLSYNLNDLGEMTSVKNQGGCGSCWAFAAYGSLESTLLKLIFENWNFSENNMKNTHGFDWGHCDGGNRGISTAYLTRWSGPVNEIDDPYSTISNISPGGLTIQKHSQDVYFIPDRGGSLLNDEIKNAIMAYGALRTSMRWEGSQISDSPYFDYSNGAYYYNGASSSTNHGVTIAGWDDNYSATNFISSNQPPGDGAFLIKNSWGTTWANSGYLWISYYDPFVTNCAVFLAEPTDNYDHVYQYDPLGAIGTIGYGGTNYVFWGANIFKNTTGSDHVINAVSFYAQVPDTEYTIRIYINVTPDNPDSGTLAHEQSGTITYPGYRTVPLATSGYSIVLLNEGYFSVVIGLTTPGYGYPQSYEYAYPGYSSAATANWEESFYGPDGSSWFDLHTYNSSANFAIKAFGVIHPTYALISDFRAFDHVKGALIEWQTGTENGTVGFDLYRLNPDTGRYLKVNKKLLPGLLNAAQGGVYRCVDKGAAPGKAYTYKLVEVDNRGKKNTYGPFNVTVGWESVDEAFEKFFQAENIVNESGYSSIAHQMTEAKKDRIAAMHSDKKASKEYSKSDIAKISVAQNGLYYVDAAEIAYVMGETTSTVSSRIKRKQFILNNQGKEIAWLCADENAGIYFYGESINSIYTDRNVYLLKIGKKDDGLQMIKFEGNQPFSAIGNGAFEETIHAEEDHFALTALFDDPMADYWLWDFIISGNPDHSTKTFNISTHSVAETDSARLTVYLLGITDNNNENDHYVSVTLNETWIGEGHWSGASSHELVLEFGPDLLNEGKNTIEVTGLLDDDVPYSIFYVDSFDLAYPRYYQAVDNRLFLRGDEHDVVTVSGFTSDDILVFDLGDPKTPRIINAAVIGDVGSGYQISFTPAASDILYLATTKNMSNPPLSIAAYNTSDLRQKQNRADYLIIAPSEFKKSAEDLAAYRQAQNLDAMVVDIEEIMDEFNEGVFSPEAIKEFLSFAYHNWKKAPRYVVLAGVGTYDYKDNMGYGDNMVPTPLVATPYGLFASDNRYADVLDNDGVPDIAIGRLPAVTSEEFDGMINKIKAYESANGNWARKILMVADNPDDGGDFPAASNAVAEILPTEYLAEKIYLSEYPIEEAHQLILDEINDGALLLNYLGHAGLDRLAQEGMLLSNDVAFLENNKKLPIVTAMTCVVGRYAIPGFDSLAELLVLHEGGGAIATWSPTGLSFNELSVILNKNFFHSLFTDEEKILGDVVLKALESYYQTGKPPYMMDIYNLLGDPALIIR